MARVRRNSTAQVGWSDVGADRDALASFRYEDLGERDIVALLAL